jgi:hypothetical protein
MTIAIDFDGTCVTHEFPKVGREIGAAPVLKKLVQNGHKLILFTMRSRGTGTLAENSDFPGIKEGDYLQDAIDWFAKHEIPLYGIQHHPTQKEWTSSPKCYAHMIIDDTALGCPLIQEGNERPYVNWGAVKIMLAQQGLLTLQQALINE